MMDLLRQDAAEMADILRSARCVERHLAISHHRLAEILTALVTGGELTSSNSRGHDVLSPTFGRIEVKSRILGTDGPFPRVTLKAANIEKSDFFIGVRWTRDMRLHEALGLPKSAVVPLYTAKRQSTGSAHLSWADWTAAPGARSFLNDMRALLE
ncbi:hypothetical protein GBZ48_18210 [Azospirillum melinis]|uniref:Uncharacterized protein n=1 Tax=Azospirillum melinis TaxID=328839 RepID=A0ABX2KC76_9PROT|nr:hypothetical protein [Azospirillum melinis]MBP2309683.1 hypothetical protein [Azospirillum melinis]NUB01205.1 hypothetical protein [Azospirillum melinis]